MFTTVTTAVVCILLGNLIFLADSSSVFDKNLEECFRKQRDYEAQAKATLTQVQHWDTATTIPVLHTYIRSDANVDTKKKFIQSAQESIKIQGYFTCLRNMQPENVHATVLLMNILCYHILVFDWSVLFIYYFSTRFAQWLK